MAIRDRSKKRRPGRPGLATIALVLFLLFATFSLAKLWTHDHATATATPFYPRVPSGRVDVSAVRGARQPAKKAAPVDGVPHGEVALLAAFHKQAEEIKDLKKHVATHEIVEQPKAPPPPPPQQPRAQAPHAVGLAKLQDAFDWELGAVNSAGFAVIIGALESAGQSLGATLLPWGPKQLAFLCCIGMDAQKVHPTPP